MYREFDVTPRQRQQNSQIAFSWALRFSNPLRAVVVVSSYKIIRIMIQKKTPLYWECESVYVSDQNQAVDKKL